MGCGKSSVGKKLSELLCCRFMDLDSVIEAREGRSIPEIFASDGEAAFRLMELESIRTILDDFCRVRLRKQSLPSQAMGPSLCGQRGSTVSVASPGRNPGNEMLVVALGGGTVMTPECAELVHDNTLCIYLRASLETLVRNLDGEAEGRPMLQPDRHSVRSDGPVVVPQSAEAGSPAKQLRERIEGLMALRSSTYEKTAHVIIDTDGRSIDTIAQKIVQKITQVRRVRGDL